MTPKKLQQHAREQSNATPASENRPQNAEGNAGLKRNEIAYTLSDGQVIVVKKRRSPAVMEAIGDIWSALSRLDFCWELAIEDMRQRFDRTSLGLLWIGVSYASFVLIYVAIFGRMMNGSTATVAAHIGYGFLVWNFISGAVTEGLVNFEKSGAWIKALPIPMSVFPMQSTFRLIINTVISAVITVLMVKAYSLSEPFELASPAVLLSLGAAFLIMIFTSFWVHMLLGILAARYRDLIPLGSTILRVGFFLTPVIWERDLLGEFGHVLSTWNPATHFIEIVRTPVMRGEIPTHSWLIVLVFTMIGFVVTIAIFAWARRRIIYWL